MAAQSSRQEQSMNLARLRYRDQELSPSTAVGELIE